MKFLISIIFFITLSSCSSTRYVVYDSVTGNKKIDAKIRGNYGIVPVYQSRGNFGDGGSTIPGFNYRDDYSRTFAEATHPTRIEITEHGMVIEGIIDHSTGADIRGNAANRGIRNIATLVGWNKTIEAIQ